MIISVIESFFLSIIVFKILAKIFQKNKKKNFFWLLKGKNSNKELFNIFYSKQTFVGLIIRITSPTERFWLNLTVLEIYMRYFHMTPTFYFYEQWPCFSTDQKSPNQFYAEYPKEYVITFISSLVLIGPVVSEKKSFEKLLKMTTNEMMRDDNRCPVINMN